MNALASSDEAERRPNTFRGASDGVARRGHVESYFLRANDPKRPRAFWLKATVLFPLDGPLLAESWCIAFDGERGRTFAHKLTQPWTPRAYVGADPLDVDVAGARWVIADEGNARGQMESSEGRASWDVRFSRAPGAVGAPLSIFPHRLLLDGPFPRSKLLTPYPALCFSGHIDAFGERIDVDGWHGMEGHNWGREHTYEYAWGQCQFLGDDGAPRSWVEGFSARIKLGPVISPRMSALVVQHGERTFRFDTIFDPWNQHAVLEERAWRVALHNDDARVELAMDAGAMPIACLGYRNPDGPLSYCLNSKLARTTLTLEPRGEAPIKLESAHGGALEFLRREPTHGVARVV